MTCFQLWLALGLLALALKVQADSRAAAAWFAPTQWRRPTLAPDGRFVAALAAPAPRTSLWILPAEGEESPRSVQIPSPGASVADLVWSGSDDLVVLTLHEVGGGGFWVVRQSDGGARPLSPPAGTSFVRLLHPQPHTPGTVWIEGLDGLHAPRKPKGRWLDLLAVETATGRISRSFPNPGDVVQWFVDDSGNPRLTVAIRGDRQELRLPDGARPHAGWRTATTFDAVRDPASVLALASGGNKAWVAAHLGRDTIGVYEFDLRAGRFTQPLVVDERFDIEGTLLRSGNLPVAQSWDRLMPHTAWFDPRWEETARQLAAEDGNDATRAARWVPVDLTPDGQRAVFEVHSDRSPPR